MTPEEREANRKRRETWIEGRIDNMDAGVIVRVGKGAQFLDVLIRDDCCFRATRDSDRWKEVWIRITDDLPALAEFIRALSARYNSGVDKMNMNASKTPRLKNGKALRAATPGRRKASES